MKFIQIFSTFLIFMDFAIAATVKVEPFEFKFLVAENSYDINFSLELMCRFEKTVFGDSAKFEYKYKEVPLSVSKINRGTELVEVTITNPSLLTLSQTEWYRSNKECGYIQKFYLTSRLYSIGWADQFDRAIELGLYEYSRLDENAVYPIKKLKDKIENKELGFTYRAVYNQVNIKFSIERTPVREIGGSLGTTAYRNPESNMPWPLRK